jgi:peroxiredoxin
MDWILLLFGFALPWLLVGFGGWIAYLAVRQNGRILLRLEALEQRLAALGAAPSTALAPASPRPSGLPLGADAPAFELPTVAGETKQLADFRGQRLLLIFFNPRCGFCTQMAPQLAGLPVEGAEGKPLPVILTTGDAAENRQLVQTHGLRCPVLLQQETEVAAQYGAGGTPMGYLIDEEGRIASELATGAQALLALAETPGEEAATDGHDHPRHRGNRSLADSRLPRNGLPAGTPAPDFALPSVAGGELTLSAYRGRKVLLVFSDPHCAPCQRLAPRLEAAQRRSGEVQVVMVSRGDVEGNRVKAAEHGITFPVVLQRQWEISRQYAMFATPVAYLIDEKGIVAREVATGGEAILSLLSEARKGTTAAGRWPWRKGTWQARGSRGRGRQPSGELSV